MTSATRRWKNIDKKITALALLLITAFAAVVGGLLATTNTANAAETNSTTSETTTATSTDQSTIADVFPFGGMGGFGNIDVSSEYTATVNAILNSDTDVQNLITQGYNVTSIRPIVKNIVEAAGTLTTKATTAIVTLQNGTSGHAKVSIDVSQAKVTQIVIFTRIVIDKTTSCAKNTMQPINSSTRREDQSFPHLPSFLYEFQHLPLHMN